MGRLVIISSILAVVITLGVISIVYFSNTKDSMDILLSELVYSCKSDENGDALQKANRLTAIWESRQPVLGLFIRRSDLDNIDSMLIDLNSLIEINSLDSAYTQANRIKYTLNHILAKEIPSLNNLI